MSGMSSASGRPKFAHACVGIRSTVSAVRNVWPLPVRPAAFSAKPQWSVCANTIRFAVSTPSVSISRSYRDWMVADTSERGIGSHSESEPSMRR